MNAKLTLTISLILGAITTFLFFSYIQKQAPEQVMQENLQVVIVAKEMIGENTILSAEMVEELHVSPDQIHPNTITNLTEINGMIAIAELAKGEILLTNHVQNVEQEDKYITRKVMEGYRAVAIGVNFVQSVSNLIEPGDFVDVIYTWEDIEKNIVSKLLLTKVKVLAVDRRLIKEVDEIERFEYSSVTLELLPDDTVKLVNASNDGTIHLSVYSNLSEGNE
jgi:pilus assembly protein CpaB